MLTISKPLSRWSINYYNDTARAAGQAAKDAARANGGLGEYYSEKDTRAPVWLCAGDAVRAAELVGLSDAERAGGEADPEVVARWLDDGIAPNGACGRGFGERGVHGFDLTFAAPKSVALLRAFGTDVTQKAVAEAHAAAIAEAMEYLAAHAGYTRVHNPETGKKDLVRLPGLVAIAYQHETSRAGDPHLHTHVILPNRQAREDGQLVSYDSKSLHHEAKAAGVIYQATLRRELHHALGIEWGPVDLRTGMAELAGVAAKTIRAWSQRSTQLREWAANNLVLVDQVPSAAQLAAAQKATRPTKPEHLSWAQLRQMWEADPRGFDIDMAAQREARGARLAASRGLFERRRLAEMAARIDKAAFTRADLVELLGAQLPIEVDDDQRSPRQQIEAAVADVAMRVSAPREAHQREGSERYTVDRILGEEVALLHCVDARDGRAVLSVNAADTAKLSPDQNRAVRAIAASPWLVQPLQAPAGAGKTTSMRALHSAARRARRRVIVLSPTGKAVDVAVRKGAGDVGYTVAAALGGLRENRLRFDAQSLVVVDEAAMVGTPDLRELLAATTRAGAKTVLVGDAHQLAPVKARGGMFEQLCEDLPWAQRLSEVWRMHDPDERAASVALGHGGPKPVRRAIDWYRRQERLHAGDEVTMASDALAAYQADVAAGKDALLMTDSWEMSDALNKRIHHATVAADAPAITAARGHQIAVGDTIISRKNDPTIEVYDRANLNTTADQVRNGHRWRVYAIDTDTGRIAAHRIGDDARTAFSGDYLREHITHGYATTIHANQGETAGDELTAGTAHAVLSERATRALAYVALTRGTNENHAYIYDKTPGEAEHEHTELAEGVHLATRGHSREAAAKLRAIIARDERPQTVHQVAAQIDPQHLPERVARFTAQRAAAVRARTAEHARWQDKNLDAQLRHQHWMEQQINRARQRSRSQEQEQSLDYGIDL